MNMQELFQLMQYLLATNSIDVIAGRLQLNLLKVSQNNFLDIFTNHVLMVNKPTHISGSLIDHVYLKKVLMEEFFTTLTIENIYILDHHVVRITIEKNYVDFHINP